ncbi:unnamed protein product [Triticum turgidum subsp. durum]|uniref:BAG domain-containing protein n=1 Tax=Triticum turgidum subsp. durum TaxID=4567 RepID=A0A9R1BZA9_TRITD|nr:unnamed protein product [Triticum turgidum subsp. durum]
MMRGKDQRPAAFSPMRESVAAAVQEEVWEVRPSGMLVQKRTPDSDPPPGGAPVPTIRVKDRSKMTLLEDPTAQAKRLIEERRNAKAQRAAKAVSRVSLDLDKLASKVSALETIVSKGGKVVEADLVTLTEALMSELLKLDAIVAEGDVKDQRRIQEKRVQKNVETLDAIRAKTTKKNTTPAATANKARAPHLPPRPPPAQQHQQRRQFQPAAPTTATAPAPQTATTNWDTFDLLSSAPSSSSPAPVSTMALATTTSPSPRFEWELF